jgi:PEP-CTERM motif
MARGSTTTISILCAVVLLASASAAGAAIASPMAVGVLGRDVTFDASGPVLVAAPPAIYDLPPAVLGRTPVDEDMLGYHPVQPNDGAAIAAIVPMRHDPESLPAIREFLQRQEDVQALADVSDDEMGNPLVDFSYLSMVPSGYAFVRSGKPGGDSLQWPHVTETALSYVRPHRNLQLVVSFEGAEQRPGSLKSQLVDTQAQLVDNLKVEVDTRHMVEASSAYGVLDPSAVEQKKVHSGQMIAFGIDLGLIPAVLGDVGLSTTITIGHSDNPGPFVTVATNIELPNERTQELTVDNEFQVVRDFWSQSSIGSYASSGGFADDDNGGGGGGGGTTPIPIIPEPVVPEPSTLVLLAIGSGIIAARRRRNRR